MQTENYADAWPEVLDERRDGDGVVLDLRIPDGLAYFPGHFPGMPILPGVVQIHWAIHLARGRFAMASRFQRMEVIKFKNLIRPRYVLQLHLNYQSPERRLQFAYRSHDEAFSSGRIYFHDE